MSRHRRCPKGVTVRAGLDCGEIEIGALVMTTVTAVPLTATAHTLSFEKLSPGDFERLCLWLVREEGYDDAEHLGEAGSEQGRDVVARRDGRRWVFQCKRVAKFGAAEGKQEIDKIRALPTEEQPDELVFVVSRAVSAGARKQIRAAWGAEATCRFWCGTELDAMVKRHGNILEEFFQLPPGSARRRPTGSPRGFMTVPDLPPHYLPRPEHLEPLKRAVLRGERRKLGVTAKVKVGVQGMGGVGKTVLAAAVASDPEVQQAFPGGVLWVTVGQHPEVVELQQDLAAVVGVAKEFHSKARGKSLLREALSDEAALLVLDDVWDVDHASFLDVVGPGGRLLITTRNREILVGLDARECPIEVLAPEQARALLADWAGKAPEELPELAGHVSEACGRLPLALAMIGATVRLRPTAWRDALERLERADLDKIRRSHPDYPYPDLLRAIGISVEALAPEERERYVELAVFPGNTAVPEAAVEVLWSSRSLEPLDARDLIDRLVARSLARREAAGRLRLHVLQVDYVRRQAGDLQAFHARLVHAYALRCAAGRASGPNDGYYFQRLPHHLVRADREAELEALLLDFQWLQAKLETAGVAALIDDYEMLPGKEDAGLVRSALSLAANVLAGDPRQLAGQLLGRLRTGFEALRIDRLLRQASKLSPPGVLLPRFATLTLAGGPLLRVLEGHTEAVRAVAALDGGRVVSGSNDKMLRVWDVESGESLRVLKGHARGVNAVAVLEDGRVVSASGDGTLRVWDVESGDTLRVLEGHRGAVKVVAALDGGRVISGSIDGTLRVWDLESGTTLRVLEGSGSEIYAVAVLDGRRAISASGCHGLSGQHDTLRVWDIESGTTLRVLEGDGEPIGAVVALGDGRVLYAFGRRGMFTPANKLRVWDIESGDTLGVLEGHGKIRALTALDGGRAVSGLSNGTLLVWDVESGEILRVWDVEVRRRLFEGDSDAVNAVAALEGSRAVSASSNGTLRVWDVEAGDTLRVLEGHSGEVRAVAALGGRRAVSASWEKLLVWDVESGATLRVLEGHGDVSAVAALGDGRAISASSDQLRVWDVESGAILRVLEGHAKPVYAVAVLDGGRVVSASMDKTLRVWDVETGATLRVLEGHIDNVEAVAALGGGRIVSGGGMNDQTLRVWDVETGTTVRVLEGHAGPVAAIAALGEDRVISASWTKLRVWDVESGTNLRVLEGHTGPVRAIAILGDSRAVSVSWDKSLRVWDVESGANLAVLTLDSEVEAVAVCIAASGPTVIAGDRSGGVHFLDWIDPELVRRQPERPEAAEGSLRQAVELDPDDAMAHKNLGNALLDEGRLEEAEASYRRALELDPGFAAAHFNLGTVLLEQGKPEEATPSYRRSIELDPVDAEAHILLGNALWEQKRPGEAEASLRRAIELDPDHATGHIELGNMLFDRRVLGEAEASYRRALELDPDHATGHYYLGLVLVEQGRLGEAEASYRRALELDPDHATARGALREVLRQRLVQEEEASLRGAIELDPEKAASHTGLGMVLGRQGRLDEAERSLRRAIELDPDDAAARRFLEEILEEQRRLEEA